MLFPPKHELESYPQGNSVKKQDVWEALGLCGFTLMCRLRLVIKVLGAVVQSLTFWFSCCLSPLPSTMWWKRGKMSTPTSDVSPSRTVRNLVIFLVNYAGFGTLSEPHANLFHQSSKPTLLFHPNRFDKASKVGTEMRNFLQQMLSKNLLCACLL